MKTPNEIKSWVDMLLSRRPNVEDKNYLEAIKYYMTTSCEERPLIRCKDCRHQIKEWREDKRMKDKGYWVYGCKHFGELMGYWGFGGNDNEFCSDAEQKGDT